MVDVIQPDIALLQDGKSIQRRSTKLIRFVVKDLAAVNVDVTGGSARLAINPTVGSVGSFPLVTWDEISDLVLGDGFVDLPVGLERSMLLASTTYAGQLFISMDGFVADSRIVWSGSLVVAPTLW